MKKISIILTIAGISILGEFLAFGQDGKPPIVRLNQIGFYPDAPKRAVIENGNAGYFFLVSQNKEDTLFRGTLSDTLRSQYGSKITRIADFSDFKSPGTYYLFTEESGYSYPFEIKRKVFREVSDAALKSYYFQRASTELPLQYAARWQRKAGHPDDSVLVHSSAATDRRPEGTVINSSKGWYDAGDYNKYIVNSGITMGTLLSLYEDFPDYTKNISLNIPEKDNDIPDLLDEILWNLRWMLTMQDPYDGGIYHKMTSANFSGMVMPHEDLAKRYIVQKSTAASLDFAAVMAQASRVFREYERQLPGLADSCLAAARKAWKWAEEHPGRIYNQGEMNNKFDPDIVTGAYGDRNVWDEFIWAAAELSVTTNDSRYYHSVDIVPEETISLPSWGQVQALGYYTLLRFSGDLPETARNDLPEIKKRIIGFVDSLVEGGVQTAYQTVMGHSPENFVWGSNSVAANQSIALIQAYRLTGDRRYLDYALVNIDYLLGRNATGYSFVTGYGHKTPVYPHHRPSEADGIPEPVPGFVVGGPNPGQQDDCKYPSGIADESYVDAECSYASNEIAINWNAPLVYLLQAIEALQYEAGYSTGGK